MALQHNNLDPTFSVGILLRYALIFRDVAARGKQSARHKLCGFSGAEQHGSL